MTSKFLTKEYIAKLLPKRPKDANKGTFGKVLVIAGSDNFPGAAYLCCVACYRVGAGLVTLATIPSVKIIISRKLPELTFLSFDEAYEKLLDYDVVLLGPGLGQEEYIRQFVGQLIQKKLPSFIIDGDGLNILSRIPKWWEEFENCGIYAVLTPHPKEFSRLTNLPVEEIQKERENLVKHYANEWGQVVILKGAQSVIASDDGRLALSPFENPLLATAGTGDVLAGILAGMIAQGLDLFAASCTAVFIHGLSAEDLKIEFGDTGALASDLIKVIPPLLKSLKING